MRLRRITNLAIVTLSTSILGACHNSPTDHTLTAKCLAEVTVPNLPGVQRIFRDPSFWASQSVPGSNHILMSVNAINALNRQMEGREYGFRNVLSDDVDWDGRTKKDLAERSEWLRNKVADGSYVESEDGALELALTTSRAAQPVNQFRIVHTQARLACVPMDASLYKPPIDLEFDRNRCSSLHTGEVVRVLRLWTPNNGNEHGAWLYVHAGHSVGWVRSEFVTPSTTLDATQNFLYAPSRIVAIQDGDHLRLGRSAPLLEEKENTWVINWPTAEGLVPTSIPKSASVRLGYSQFTKAAVFNAALTQLGQPYGWGGNHGHRDCSRFIMDTLGSFGIRLPRFSGYQAQSGVQTRDVRGMSDQDKLKVIQSSGQNAVVLLYMQGHIMLYLGFAEGRPWAISSISEYLRPCANDKVQTVRIDRIAISDLELGRDTERRSFLERIHTLAIFGI